MPGSFDTLHQLEADGCCRIVSAADKLQLVRSSCNGTLASRIEELDVAMAPHVVRMMEGRAPPLAALRGDGQDVSKLSALKKVAVALMGMARIHIPQRPTADLPAAWAAGARRGSVR